MHHYEQWWLHLSLPTGISRLLVGPLKPSLPQAEQVQLPQPLLGELLLSLLPLIAFPKQSEHELYLPMNVRLKEGMALHTKIPERMGTC